MNPFGSTVVLGLISVLATQPFAMGEDISKQEESKIQNPVSPIKFVREKAYSSRQAYLKSLQQPFREVESNELAFFDKRGRQIKKLSLTPDSSGYSRRPVITETGAVVIKSKAGHRSYFEF